MIKYITLIIGLIAILMSTIASAADFEYPTAACPNGITPDNNEGCIAALTETIWKLNRWRGSATLKICQNTCTGTLTGRPVKLIWKWNAQFQCAPSGSGITGFSDALAKSATMKIAIRDWLSKAASAGAIEGNDFKC